MNVQSSDKPIRPQNLTIENEGGRFFVKEKDRTHNLNHISVVILEMCTGNISVAEIAATLRDYYHLDDAPIKAVKQCVSDLSSRGLLSPSPTDVPSPS
jgi:hypothetical protein